MQIQLKQNEVITALKQYVSNQGINLAGKTVDITFTAGRKEAGLTADIVIEDGPDLPDFGSDASAEVKPALSVVKSTGVPVASIARTSETDAGLATAEGDKQTDSPSEDPPFDAEANERPLGQVMADPAAPAAKTTSLFG